MKVDSTLKIVSEFQSFIKPKLDQNLSDFCKELTSITQDDVDNAESFPVVIEKFKSWIGNDYSLCSWGFYDKSQLNKDCELNKVSNVWIKNHISLKHQYGSIKGMNKGCGMERALTIENLKLEGTHHRGIDDARNIAKIFIKLYDKWRF